MNTEQVWDAFRRWGHLEAAIDPLGRLKAMSHPELEVEGQAAERARAVYCRSIGVEFMHIPYPDRVGWIAERMESPRAEPDRVRVLEQLVRAETFEQVLQRRYIGTKRYSLEGSDALIPLLFEVLEGAAEQGAEQAIIGMSHRGRLNVMMWVVGKPALDIFAAFEDVDPRSVLGSGDVKYHVGATGAYLAENGRQIRISLVSNASHLEAVDPVLLGRARAKQEHFAEHGAARVLPILLHGDAAFAGQGIVAESLNLADIPGFSVGGTVHVIVNNLIGFTTTPPVLHSSRYASDVARRLPIPIFHVNGEDPDVVIQVARMALDYRYAFSSDVVVDLIGYRRHGHSEVDDPTVTQPLLYRQVLDRPPLWRLYAGAAGLDLAAIEEMRRHVRGELEAEQEKARELSAAPVLRTLPAYWSGYAGGPYDPAFEVDTGVPRERLADIANRISSVPEGFHVHPKVKRLLAERRRMGNGAQPVDWGMAEALAFGSLLWEGTRVRLSGQDSRRGTFNQRHSVLIDVSNEQEWAPLAHLHPGQAVFEPYDTPLSEAAPLGFEFGFSRDFPEALVLWEAQFGDFANGAQVIIDQFVSATEDKWGLLSGLVLLLPHGYEGQGPEHSSARLERFLQLAGEDNLQICQPSTAAQYFHLLRRQALRKWRKPLVVFTPKGMLRHPRAVSPLEPFTSGRFLTVVPDREVSEATRILISTGKVVHELRAERDRHADRATAVIALEQLYPFPERELEEEINRHGAAREIVWVQEEPANMGALFFVAPRLDRLGGSRHFRSIKRSASASPATGSMKAHALEQAALLALAFTRLEAA
jgi:2-oxoglutarate dehydrogenase E1 component